MNNLKHYTQEVYKEYGTDVQMMSIAKATDSHCQTCRVFEQEAFADWLLNDKLAQQTLAESLGRMDKDDLLDFLRTHTFFWLPLITRAEYICRALALYPAAEYIEEQQYNSDLENGVI